MYNRGKQIIVGELSLLLMSMNFLITLSNKLTYETSKIQKPHGIPFNLLVFKTETTRKYLIFFFNYLTGYIC